MEQARIENFIQTQWIRFSQFNEEYLHLYNDFKEEKIRLMLSQIHYDLNWSFTAMNTRLPTKDDVAHFWAEHSRVLLNAIEVALKLHETLMNTENAFDIDEYYHDVFGRCLKFLCQTQGSTIPPNMNKVDIYLTIPIFKLSNSVVINNGDNVFHYQLTHIGEGSYADVYKYFDVFYNRHFVVKKAKNVLNNKELERFKIEYETMKQINSPYVVEVYNYDKEKQQYVMEYLDYSLLDFLQTKRNSLQKDMLYGIVLQILKAFEYLHSKEILHRDISPNNVLIKSYEDVNVAKISDFGLVKIPNSYLTSKMTEFKGCLNDPKLKTDGFDSYSILHETYALTMLIFYIMTGRTNVDNINNNEVRFFVNKGLSSDKNQRYKNVADIKTGFKNIGVQKWL
ncbi:MAG: protein kinase family protein [Candidatus Cloacimonetes bacterium]|nr:protein kinase family protein [Candidatus Cloacimonadota bacterium]